jgi:hypothetical protein
MLTFMQWVETVGLRWPQDCSGKVIKRRAEAGNCYSEPGAEHEKIKSKATKMTVTVVPRHNRLNPNTCRSIIKKVEGGC